MSSEILSEWVPGARLVKSISNIPMDWINDFSPNKPRTAIFTSGDDEEAKRVVIDLLNQVGLGPISGMESISINKTAAQLVAGEGGP